MEENYFEEIFEKLNILEAENKILKDELESLDEDKAIQIDNYITNNPDENLNEVREIQNKINNQFFSSQNGKDNKITELILNFKPFDELNSMEITGDFTNWNKKAMEKVFYLTSNK